MNKENEEKLLKVSHLLEQKRKEIKQSIKPRVLILDEIIRKTFYATVSGKNTDAKTVVQKLVAKLEDFCARESDTSGYVDGLDDFKKVIKYVFGEDPAKKQQKRRKGGRQRH